MRPFDRLVVMVFKAPPCNKESIKPSVDGFIIYLESTPTSILGTVSHARYMCSCKHWLENTDWLLTIIPTILVTGAARMNFKLSKAHKDSLSAGTHTVQFLYTHSSIISMPFYAMNKCEYVGWGWPYITAVAALMWKLSGQALGMSPF